MTTKDEVRSTVEALKLALTLALEALEETRNALAWFYDSYPQDVTKKGNELLPHVETVLTTIRAALASKSEALASEANEQPAPVAEPHKQQELSSASVEPVAVYVGETWCGSVVRLYEDLPLETPLYTSSQPADELERERAIELSRAYQEGYARAIQNTTPPYVATPLAAQPAPEQKEDLYELAKQADNWGQP